MLRYLKENSQIYEQLNRQTTRLAEEIKKQYESEGLHYTMNQVGSMFTLFFTDKPVHDFDSAKTSDTRRFANYFQSMLQQGVYLAPSQFEAMFVSTAINDPIIDQILQASKKALKNVAVSV
jgi:glutamate-1-semialdehyde 2,1-aminomutase